MAMLNPLEKRRLEQLFGMGTGYVLNFTDRTFAEFVLDVTRKDIWDPKYSYASGSKANRLRAFWTNEPPEVVGRLLRALVELARELVEPSELHDECERVAERLLNEAPVPEIDAIEPNADGRDFEALAKSVRASLEANEPEAGLDRLHTFAMKYIRVLCEKRGIDTSRDKPLHSIFGAYVKHLRAEGAIESEMSDRILRTSISILESFNDVRNEQSLAHDNKILGYEEALLIFNNVASCIRYLAAIERRLEAAGAVAAAPVEDDEIPF